MSGPAASASLPATAADTAPNGEARLLWRVPHALCAMAVFSVLLFKVTRFKDRWFHPLFVTVPMLAAVVVSDSLSRARLKAVLMLGAVSAAVVLALAPGRLFPTERLHKRDVLNAPFRQLAPGLAPLIQRADFVVTDSWTAGNLTLWFPGKLAITPELLSCYPPPGPRCLVIWEVSPRNDPPKDLAAFARQYAGTETLPQPAYLEECWNWHRQGTISLGALAIEKSP